MIRHLLATTISLLTAVAFADTQRVYIGTSHSTGIWVADFDQATGKLSAPKLAVEVERPGFLVVHPSGKYVFSTSAVKEGGKSGGVAAFKVNGDGTLTLINQQSSGGNGACHVSLDQSGKVLMVANYGDGTVASYKVADDGSLSKPVSVHQNEGKPSVPNPKRQNGPHAHSTSPSMLL